MLPVTTPRRAQRRAARPPRAISARPGAGLLDAIEALDAVVATLCDDECELLLASFRLRQSVDPSATRPS